MWAGIQRLRMRQILKQIAIFKILVRVFRNVGTNVGTGHGLWAGNTCLLQKVAVTEGMNAAILILLTLVLIESLDRRLEASYLPVCIL